jgi:hypothetical protein
MRTSHQAVNYISTWAISLRTVLKDGRRFYENGLPTPTAPSQLDRSSNWGRVPLNPYTGDECFQQ